MKIKKYKDFIIERLKLSDDFIKVFSVERTVLDFKDRKINSLSVSS